MLHQQILKKHQELQNQIIALQKKLAAFPEGKLICARNGSRWKWYESNGKTKTYIPKKHKAKAEKLAAKKYLSLVLKDLKCEKKAIDFYLKHYREPQSQKLLTSNTEYEKLLAPFFQPSKKQPLAHRFRYTRNCFFHFSLFATHLLFLLHDHFLNHFAANGTSLSRSQVTVVAFF